MGVDPTAVKPTVKFHRTAAEYFLDTALDNYTDQLNQEWQTNVTFQWKERYTYASQIQASLSVLERKAQNSTLSVEEAWNRAQWTLELKDREVALPLIKAVLDLDSNHAEANYVLGRILADQSNPEAIAYLEAAMEQDQNTILSGCQIIGQLLRQQGRDSEIEPYSQRAQAHYQMLMLAEQERTQINASDEFMIHKLPESDALKLRKQLCNYPHVGQVFLAQKKVHYFPEKPLYVMLVIRKSYFWKLEPSVWKLESMSKEEQLVDKLAKELNLPGRFLITSLTDVTNPLLKKLRKLEQKPFYQK